jgi:membrane associated rhomboid family serine protease
MDTAIRATPRAGQAQEWSLVLEAAGIPHRVVRDPGEGWVVVVPADEAVRARRALEDDADERGPDGDPGGEGDAGPVPWTTGAVAGLLLLGCFAVTGRPAAASPWFERGAAAAGLLLSGQPWRALTALTLHLDAAHVAGNAVATAVLLPALAQRLGGGLALALVVLAGAAGNVLAALAHAPEHVAVGASTATFGAIGMLAALRLLPRSRAGGRPWRAWTVPVAGLLLVAMLGTGRSADVVAHALGLVSGAACGAAAAPIGRPPGPLAQGALGGLAVGAVLGAWWLALRG